MENFNQYAKRKKQQYEIKDIRNDVLVLLNHLKCTISVILLGIRMTRHLFSVHI